MCQPDLGMQHAINLTYLQTLPEYLQGQPPPWLFDSHIGQELTLPSVPVALCLLSHLVHLLSLVREGSDLFFVDWQRL